jgi:hypothetical protein
MAKMIPQQSEHDAHLGRDDEAADRHGRPEGHHVPAHKLEAADAEALLREDVAPEQAGERGREAGVSGRAASDASRRGIGSGVSETSAIGRRAAAGRAAGCRARALGPGGWRRPAGDARRAEYGMEGQRAAPVTYTNE